MLVHPHFERCLPVCSPHCQKKKLLGKVEHHFTRLTDDLQNLTGDCRSLVCEYTRNVVM